jgi:hypothetical protein
MRGQKIAVESRRKVADKLPFILAIVDLIDYFRVKGAESR